MSDEVAENTDESNFIIDQMQVFLTLINPKTDIINPFNYIKIITYQDNISNTSPAAFYKAVPVT